MNVLDRQYQILAGWAGGLGWYMEARFMQAGAVTLEVTADGIAGKTAVAAFRPWLLAAACAEVAEC